MHVEYGYGPGGQFGRTETTSYGSSQVQSFTPSYQPKSTYQNYSYSDSSRQQQVSENLKYLGYGEDRASRSALLKAVQNGEDWHAAAEIDESQFKSSEYVINKEALNTTYLLSIRQALIQKNNDFAWELACHGGRKVDEYMGAEKGFNVTARAALYGYSDVYFFLVEKLQNPRFMDRETHFNLMDYLDQGTCQYGCNNGHLLIKQDLIRRGIQINGRKPHYDGCCLI